MTRSKYWIAYLFAVFSCLTVLDYALTKKIIDVTGADGEFNPVMRWVIETVGIKGIFYCKMLSLLVAALVVVRVPANKIKLVENGLSFCFLVYGVNLLWTFYVMHYTLK